MLYAAGAGKSWREDAVRIVEELFPGAPAGDWDLLLDLRAALQAGTDWARTLDLFLICRERLEAGQYLPFYRLRRLLAESLRLEAGSAPVGNLRQILARKHRSLDALRRAVARDVFEHDLAASESVALRVVEAV
jgi:hypothetical protein